jgi:hypothetical protein
MRDIIGHGKQDQKDQDADADVIGSGHGIAPAIALTMPSPTTSRLSDSRHATLPKVLAWPRCREQRLSLQRTEKDQGRIAV